MKRTGNSAVQDSNESAPALTIIQRFVERERKDIKQCNFWRAVFGEFIGTMILCLWSIVSGLYHPVDDSPPDVLSGAIANGFVVAVLVNSLANVSGGHVNPAVSMGFLVAQKITCVRFICYVIGQCLGAVAAVICMSQLVPMAMFGRFGILLPGIGVTPIQACSAEFAITFFYLFGIFAMTDDKRKDNTAPVPLYYGLIIASSILFAARISGGCLNPARSFGPAIVSGMLDNHWIYWVGPMFGAASGAILYQRLLSADAMTGPCSSCCRRKSRGQRDDTPIEREQMLTTET